MTVVFLTFLVLAQGGGGGYEAILRRVVVGVYVKRATCVCM